MPIKIFACGDIVIQKYNGFSVSEDLGTIIKEADIAVCNFEGPVQAGGSKIPKAGPYLEQAQDSVDILRGVGFNLFSLANNHILDFGEEGLAKTIEKIEKAGARYVGAGVDFGSAYKLIEYEINSLKIGFLAFAEYGFGVLSEGGARGGYAWIEHPSVNKIVRESKAKVDRLIVMVHAGAEDVLLPLPEWRSRYRALCDNGADIIIGHHPHLPQGFERYNRSVIFYSLGNFFFGYAGFGNMGNVSYSVLLEISLDGFDFRTIWHKKTSDRVILLNDQRLFDYLEKISSFLGERYEYLTDQQVAYLYDNRYKKYLGLGVKNNAVDFIKRFLMFREYKRNKSLMHLHNSMIESHRYVIRKAIKLIQKKKMRNNYPDIAEMAKEYSGLDSLHPRRIVMKGR